MASVEIMVAEDRLVETMETMRTWLDHMRFRPDTFRYTFSAKGIVLRTEFSVEDEAASFARAFDGKLVIRQLGTVL